MHPFIKEPGVAREVAGIQFHHLAHRVVHVRDRAAAVGVAAYLVDQARHPGRDVLDEAQLARQRLGGFALGRDVLHHPEVGLRIARHRRLADAGAQPALLAVGPLPAVLQLAPVLGLARALPGRHVIGVDAGAAHAAAHHGSWVQAGDREQPG